MKKTPNEFRPACTHRSGVGVPLALFYGSTYEPSQNCLCVPGHLLNANAPAFHKTT